MTPILGILASSITPSLVAGDYQSIATVTVGSGGSSTVSFTSIPSTYKHLQLRFLIRSEAVANTCAVNLRFNADTGSNYYLYHELFGDGSTAGAFAGGGSTRIQLDQFPAASRGANIFGAGVLDVLDYTSTNKHKTTRLLGGYDSNGAGAMNFASGLWFPSTIAAVNQITLTDNTGVDFAEYSQFALYGIK
jgi:hypothetical protein